MDQLSSLTTVMGRDGQLAGLVVKDAAEYARTEESLQYGRTVEKAFASATEKTPEQKQRERDITAVKKFIAALNKMHRDALGTFKRKEKERVEEEARAAAQAEFDRIEAEKQKEAKRLRKLAKKAKGQEKRDLENQAREVLGEPIQSVESAVDEAVQDATSSLKGSTPTLWHAEVDSLTELVLWVAEAPAERIEFVQPHLVNLNSRARTKKSADLGIPGVVGVGEESYR